MNPKEIKIESTTMCSPDYSRWNRKVAGKKKHYISVKNNRLHTYKLIDGERIECNEGRCKVIKEEFYRSLDREYMYPNELLPNSIREFLGSVFAVKKERGDTRRQYQHSGSDHLDLCEHRSKYCNQEYPMLDERAVAYRVHWILQHKLKKFSNPDSEFDSLFRVNTFGGRADYRIPMKAEAAHVYLRVLDWLECDAWPTRIGRRYIAQRGEWVEYTEAIPLNEGGSIWTDTDTLKESDYIYFVEPRHPMTMARLYRDGTLEYLPRMKM